jgi:hypothetical protein
MSVCGAGWCYGRDLRLNTRKQDNGKRKRDDKRGERDDSKVKEKQTRKKDVRLSAQTRDPRYLESLSCGLAAYLPNRKSDSSIA